MSKIMNKEVRIVANATVIAVVVYALLFFVMAYIVMSTYNNSIPYMNDNYKAIDYSTALWFTLFLSVIGLYIKSHCGREYKHYIM